MGELTIGHFLLYAVLIVATMATLDWLESLQAPAPAYGRRRL